MRTLDASQKQAQDRKRLKPVYLLEITLKNSGPTLYFADRNITVGSQIYEKYISKVTDFSEKIERRTSRELNARAEIEFINGKFRSYTRLIEIDDTYPFTGADVVVKKVYLDDNSPSSALTVFKGMLDEPRNIDLMKFTCSISGMSFKADLQN